MSGRWETMATPGRQSPEREAARARNDRARTIADADPELAYAGLVGDAALAALTSTGEEGAAAAGRLGALGSVPPVLRAVAAWRLASNDGAGEVICQAAVEIADGRRWTMEVRPWCPHPPIVVADAEDLVETIDPAHVTTAEVLETMRPWPRDRAGARVTPSGDGGETLAAAVCRWASMTPAGSGWLSVLTVGLEAAEVPLPPVTANVRVDPILPAIRISQAPERDRGQLLGGLIPDDPPAALPLVPDAALGVRVPLLEVADAYGVVSMARGRGAPLDLRLVVEALLSVPPEHRTAETPIVITVGELLAALSGPKPRGGRLAEWQRIRAALCAANTRWIPWRSGGRWWPLRLRGEPGEQPQLADTVVLTVSCPPGSGSGPLIDRQALREAGRHSGPRYRVLIGVPTVAWKPGRTRMPCSGAGGLWVGDRRRYTVLHDEDRRRIAFGPAPADKGGRRTADADRIIRDTPGLVVMDERARDHVTGRPGWLVVPDGAAKAIGAAEAAGRRRRDGESAPALAARREQWTTT